MAYRIYMPLPNPLPCRIQSAITDFEDSLRLGIGQNGGRYMFERFLLVVR